MSQPSEETQPLQLIPRDQGEHWLIAGETTTVKVSGHATAGGLLLLETLVPPGGGPTMLARHRFLETFRVLEGEFAFDTLDAAGAPHTLRAAAGDTVLVPPLAWHRYRNVGPGPGRLFTVFNSAVIEELAEAIGQRIDDPAHPPVPQAPAPEGLRQAGELMQQYQIETQSPSQNFR